MCFAARSHSFKTSSLLHKVGEEVLQEKAPSPLQSGGSPDVCGEFGEVPQIQSTDPWGASDPWGTRPHRVPLSGRFVGLIRVWQWFHMVVTRPNENLWLMVDRWFI